MTDAPEPLPDSLTQGLTIWGPWGGAQIRGYAHVTGHDDDTGLPVIDGEDTILAVHLAPDVPRSPEDGAPALLDADAARALRDLLNIATARGSL